MEKDNNHMYDNNRKEQEGMHTGSTQNNSMNENRNSDNSGMHSGSNSGSSFHSTTGSAQNTGESVGQGSTTSGSGASIGSSMNRQTMGEDRQSQYGQEGHSQYGNNEQKNDQTHQNQFGQTGGRSQSGTTNSSWNASQSDRMGKEGSSYGNDHKSGSEEKCDACQEDFDKNVDRMVGNVEDYGQKEHQNKEKEVDGAFGSQNNK